MNLYTSDLHFGHENVIRFDGRPFASADDMDRQIIELWNNRVQPNDTVYIVGDFCHRSSHPAEWYLKQLRGHKVLIIGNHDKPILDSPEAVKYFESIDKMMHISDQGRQICLCHFPIAEWNGYYRSAWHIYGHIHNRKNETYDFMKTKEKALNAGCMLNNYTPVSFDELIHNNKKFQEDTTIR